MKTMNKILFLASITALSCLTACSVNGADDDIYLDIDPNAIRPNGDKDSDPDIFNPTTLADSEFVYNYNSLDIYYLNHDEVGDIFEYYNKTKEGTVADIYYMYSKMSDPMTNYYDPTIGNYIMTSLIYSDANIGIGAQVESFKISDSDSALVFTQVYPKGPAEKAGIRKGDTVLTVRGTKPANAESFDVLASGNVGQTVKIEVKRNEKKTFEVILNEFLTPSVFLDSIENIPVIRITEFASITPSDSGSYGEFVNALNKTQGAKSTIIDLRGNGGGIIEQCVSIASELLGKGDTIISYVQAEYDSIRDAQRIDTLTYEAIEKGIGADRYYVILADSNSASCSETMISAITVNKKSPVVGLLSYGKGCGQYYLPTYAGGVSVVTAIMAYDKNWKSFHKVGIEPDFVEKDKATATAKAVELAKSMTVTRTKGYGTKDLGRFDPKPSYKSNSLNKKAASTPTWEYGQAAVIKDFQGIHAKRK